MAGHSTGDLRIALSFLRMLRGWTQAQMAEAAGVDKSVICSYELGRRTPTPRSLNKLLKAVNLTPLSLDWLLGFVRSAREAMEGGHEVTLGMADFVARASSAAIRLAIIEGLEEHGFWGLPPADEASAAEARARAEALWTANQGLRADDWRLLIEESAEFQGWAVSERLCLESARAVRAERSVELAELALLVAGRMRGNEVLRSRLQSCARARLAEARRAAPGGAPTALPRARTGI